jgi:hypothetical protein
MASRLHCQRDEKRLYPGWLRRWLWNRNEHRLSHSYSISHPWLCADCSPSNRVSVLHSHETCRCGAVSIRPLKPVLP